MSQPLSQMNGDFMGFSAFFGAHNRVTTPAFVLDIPVMFYEYPKVFSASLVNLSWFDRFTAELAKFGRYFNLKGVVCRVPIYCFAHFLLAISSNRFSKRFIVRH